MKRKFLSPIFFCIIAVVSEVKTIPRVGMTKFPSILNKFYTLILYSGEHKNYKMNIIVGKSFNSYVHSYQCLIITCTMSHSNIQRSGSGL
jgi:hypothetical protein